MICGERIKNRKIQYRTLNELEYMGTVRKDYGMVRLETSPKRTDFHANIDYVDIGPLKMAAITNNAPFKVYRSAQECKHSANRFVLSLLQAGSESYRIKYRGKTIDCSPTQISLLDARSPLEVHQLGAAQSISISLPANMLRSQYRKMDHLCGQVIDSSTGSGAILKSLMVSSMHHVDEIEEAESYRLLSSITSMMISAFEKPSLIEATRIKKSDRIYDHIIKFINEYYSDPELSLTMMSEYVGYSESYIKLILSDKGQSLHKLIIEKRLMASAQLLCSPKNVSGSVTEVAYGTGFQSLSHFCRRFTEMFGMPPNKYRDKAIKMEAPLPSAILTMSDDLSFYAERQGWKRKG